MTTQQIKNIILEPESVKAEVFFNPNSLNSNENITNTHLLVENRMANVLIHPSDEEKTLEDDLFSSVYESIMREIKFTQKYCQGLNKDYISDSLQQSDAILIVRRNSVRDKTLYGFASLKINDEELHIDVICTNTDVSGTGSYMIKLLVEFCEASYIENFTLKSVTNAVGFYAKNGFVCNDGDGLCPMKKMVPYSPRGGKKSRRRRCKKRYIKRRTKTNRN